MDLGQSRTLDSAITNIVNEREKNGNYNSLVNFINRVNAKDVNKLQLEGLVKAGAFDEFDNDRNKILNSIPIIIQKIKNINDDKQNRQSNLFMTRKMKKLNLNFFQQNHGDKKNFYRKNLNQLGFI